MRLTTLLLVALIGGASLADGVSARSLFDFLSSRGASDSKARGLTLDQVRAELEKSNHLTTDQMENLFDRAADYTGELYHGNTVLDYKKLLHKEIYSCNLASFKRRVSMYHGRSESSDKRLPVSNIRINLTRFCRRQLYLLIDECLEYHSVGGRFHRTFDELYKREREWESRQPENFMGPTPMEKYILDSVDKSAPVQPSTSSEPSAHSL